MNDLISRAEALRLVEDYETLYNRIDRLPSVRPSVVCNITGGVLQGASSDYPLDVYSLDFETDKSDTGVVIEGSDAYLGQCSARVDPTFVQEVIEAPEVYFLTGEPVDD